MSLVPDPLERPFLTAAETGPIFGMGVSAVHDAIGRGEIPAVRIGRRVLIPTAALRRDVLRIDPPGPSVPDLVAALRQLLREEDPGGSAGSSSSTTCDDANHHEEGQHAA